jgi:hypothetical protein
MLGSEEYALIRQPVLERITNPITKNKNIRLMIKTRNSTNLRVLSDVMNLSLRRKQLNIMGLTKKQTRVIEKT